MSIRILIVDDSQLFRKGLAALIAGDADFLVVSDIPGGTHVTQSALDAEPDIILMDMQLAGMNGLEAGAQIKRLQPHIRIVVLTALKSDQHVRTALWAGVDGYILKDATVDELKVCLRAVANGRKFLSHDVSGMVVDSLLRPEQFRAGNSRLDLLTRRERSILQLVAEGRTNRGAAAYLNISPKTIEKHRSSLMHKLGLRNVAELTLVAVDLGLIERPSSVTRLAGDTSR